MPKPITYYVLFYFRGRRIHKQAVDNPMQALENLSSMSGFDFTEAQCNAKIPGQLLPVRQWLLTID